MNCALLFWMRIFNTKGNYGCVFHFMGRGGGLWSLFRVFIKTHLFLNEHIISHYPVCPVGGISPIRTVQVFNHAPLKEYTSFCGTCTICKFYLIVDALCRILVSTFTQIAEFMWDNGTIKNKILVFYYLHFSELQDQLIMKMRKKMIKVTQRRI